MTDQNHDSIISSLGELKGLYTGILNQTTRTNGRVDKIEVKVESLEKSRDRRDGLNMSWREILGYITGIAGIIFGVVSIIINWG